MKIQVRSAIAGVLAGAIALTGAGLLAGAPAEAAAVAPRIIGGEKVDSNPWVVQLGIFLDSAHTKGSGCTSEAMNESWLISAKHCVTKPDNSVYIPGDLFAVYTNNTADIRNRAKRIAVDKVVTWGSGDVALIHLASATKLTAFAQIAANTCQTPATLAWSRATVSGNKTWLNKQIGCTAPMSQSSAQTLTSPAGQLLESVELMASLISVTPAAR